MKYEEPELGVSFTIPDKLTVGVQLEYHSIRDFYEPEEKWLKTWEASKVIVEDWKCGLLPDMEKLNINQTDPRITKIVRWTAGEAAAHMAGLESVPKG